MTQDTGKSNKKHFIYYAVIAIVATIFAVTWNYIYYPDVRFENVWVAWIMGYFVALILTYATVGMKNRLYAVFLGTAYAAMLCVLYIAGVVEPARDNVIEQWKKTVSAEECTLHIYAYGKGEYSKEHHFHYSPEPRASGTAVDASKLPAVSVSETDFPSDGIISIHAATGLVQDPTPPIKGWCYDETYPFTGERIVGARFTE